MTTIYFYITNDEYGFLSNFARYPIILKNKTWPTSEHYFQAQKFADTVHEEAVRKTDKPKDAAKMGRDRTLPLRPDWESIKDQVMYEAVYAKFTQHDYLKKALLETNDAKLVEHTNKDSYWGDGGDGSGKNMLGKILMDVREKIRKDNSQ